MPGYFLFALYYLVMAFVIGTLAQILTGYRKRRLFTTVVLGFIGVMAGDLLSKHFGFPDLHIINIFNISIIWSTLGAVLFIVLFRLARGEW